VACIVAAAGSAARAGVLPTRIPGPSSPWSGLASIPDNDADGVTIDLPIAGALYPIADVTISITLAHTWIGDLEAVLESPSGFAKLRLFDRPGYRKSGNAGYASNLNGTYTFDDYAAADLWATIAPLTNAENVPGGSYRTSTRSRVPHGVLVAQSSSGGCATYLSGAFGGLPPTFVDGTWKLRLYDHAGADAGSVTQVLLSVNYPERIYRTGFEIFGATGATYTGAKLMEEFGTYQAPIVGSAVRGACRPAQYDTDGDGWSDFVVVDPDDGDSHSVWSVRNNDGTPGGAFSFFTLGSPNRIYLMDDFDGDGLDDAVVWSRSADGVFQVRRSSRPGHNMFVHFGSDGELVDDPTQSGDFDGDGVADLAVFRVPAGTEPDGPAQWLLALSTSGSNELRTYDTGLAGIQGEFFPIAGFDSTGDGFADLQLQTASTGNPVVAHWYLFDGTSGQLVSEFDFQNATDVIVPGNHVGNFQADVTVRRMVSGVSNHYFRDGQTGATSGPVVWGVLGDFSTPGDHDGDGLDDLAVWRSSTATFYVRKSTDPAATFEVPLGTADDFPVAASRIH
jgi:hypothetical protein